MQKLDGKTVLVTGASSGIGKDTALRLLARGATVYAAARRTELMQDLAAAGARVVRLDMTDEPSLQATVDAILAERGSVDMLVNNAGYGSFGAVEDIPLAEARRQFEVNIFGLARLTQLVLPGMRGNRYGKIVNISSMGGKMYTPFGSWYHATKYALEAFSDCLRLETASFGIDVIIIEPGCIATEWGHIASENLKNTSGNGAYGGLARRVAGRMAALYASRRVSPASLIGRTIEKAVTARRPRTRYAVGFMAKPSIFIRTWFGDRLFDRLLMALA